MELINNNDLWLVSFTRRNLLFLYFGPLWSKKEKIFFCATNLEAMPKAVIKASLKPFIKVYGFFRVKTKNTTGNTIRAWTNKPHRTVTMYSPSFPIVFKMSSMPATRAAAKLHTPMGAILKKKKRHKGITCLLMSSLNKTSRE